MCSRGTMMPWALYACLAAVFIILPMLAGCAESRYLTKEQDEEMRQACEPAGCMVMPAPMWEQIKRALGIEGV